MSEEIEETQEENAPTKKLYYDPLSVARRSSQKIHLVQNHDKPALLLHLLKTNELSKIVVIIKTKREADTLCKFLQENDFKALCIHSNKSAKECESAVSSYDKGETDILIMTDMILQAQTLSDINCMISYNIPSEPSHYYERITALKELGEGIAFVCEEEGALMDAIEWAMKVEILEEEVEGFENTIEPEVYVQKATKVKKPRHKKTKSKKLDKKKEEKNTDDK